MQPHPVGTARVGRKLTVELHTCHRETGVFQMCFKSRIGYSLRSCQRSLFPVQSLLLHYWVTWISTLPGPNLFQRSHFHPLDTALNIVLVAELCCQVFRAVCWFQVWEIIFFEHSFLFLFLKYQSRPINRLFSTVLCLRKTLH